MRDRFGIFGTVTRIRKLSLLLVMMLRIPNRLHHFKGSRATVGYLKKGYPNQNNKNCKRQSKPATITRARARAPACLTPWRRAEAPAHPWVSGASSASPDPSGGRAPTPPHPSPRLRTRLPTCSARTHDVTDAVTPIPLQGMVATIPTTPDTVALPLLLCHLTSFIVVYHLTVKEE